MTIRDSLSCVPADNRETWVQMSMAVRKTGLPWWMPSGVGDADDYHLSHGFSALAEAIDHLWRARQGQGLVAAPYASGNSG